MVEMRDSKIGSHHYIKSLATELVDEWKVGNHDIVIERLEDYPYVVGVVTYYLLPYPEDKTQFLYKITAASMHLWVSEE